MSRLLLIGALALSLTACGPKSLAIVKPPAERLVCDPEPGRPVGSGPSYVDPYGVTRNAVTDEDDGAYKVALRASGQSCRDDVEWLRDFFFKLKD